MMAQTRNRQRVTMFIFLFCTSLVLKRISASSSTSSVVATSESSGSSSVGPATNTVTTPISTSSVVATSGSSMTITSASSGSSSVGSTTNIVTTPILPSSAVATSGSSMTITSASSGSSSVGPATNTVTTPISTSSVVATSGSSMTITSGSSSVGPATNTVTTPISTSSVVATSGSSMTITSSSSGSSSVGSTTNIVTTPISPSSAVVTSGSSMTITSGSSSVGSTTNIVTTPISPSSAVAASRSSMTITSGSSGSSSVGSTTNTVTTPISTSSVVTTSGSSTTATSGGSLLNSSPSSSSVTPAGTSDSPKNSSSVTPEASSTSSTSTTPTVKTTPASVQHVEISDLTADVAFTIKFNGNFNETLYDKNSQTFKDKSAEYKKNLTEVFNKTQGFKSVSVTGFWKGSIGVDYTVQYYYSAATDTENFKNNLTSVKSDLKNLPGVDIAYVNATFAAEVGKAIIKVEEVKGNPCNLENACLPFWNCTKDDASITCTDPCHKFDCRSPGFCFIDDAGRPRCRCPPDDKYIYGGETCEQKAEKLDLPFTTIIGIACGVGGGLVFILIVALVFTCCRRSGKDRVHDDQKSEVSFQSLTGMQGTHPDPALTANRFYRQQTGQDPSTATSFLRQDSGLPMDSQDRPGFRQKDTRPEDPSPSGQTRYGEDGRVYKVVKDSQIYSPVAYKNQAFESFPEEKPLNYRRLSQSGYSRVSHHQRGPRENVYDHLKEYGYRGLEPPDVHRNPVYNDISDETTIVYQPSDETPRSRESNASYKNPVMTVDPSELSGFARRDDIRRPDEVTRISDDRSRQRDSVPRYSDWPQESYRRGEHPGAPVRVYPETETIYPARDSVFPARENAFRDSREHGYPGKERDEAVYSKPSKAVRPGGMDDGINTLIHDFSDRGMTQQQGMGPYSSPDKRSGADRAKVYDYVPEGKMVVHRPVYSNRPLY